MFIDFQICFDDYNFDFNIYIRNIKKIYIYNIYNI